MKGRIKKAAGLFLAMTVAVCAMGIPAGAEEEKKNEDEILIGYSPMTLVNEYFSAVEDAIQEVCDENGATLITYDPQMDATKQATQIEDMISMGIQALVYIPVDSAGGRTIMQECKDAGIYVVNIDNLVIEDDSDVVDCKIASDNYGLGYLSGQDVAERFPDGANIVIAHSPTSESCNVTVGAFWDAIKENAENPDKFEELMEFDGQGDTAVSFEYMVDALEAYDDIDVVYCVNDASALGVIQAIEESGKGEDIAVYGKDGSPNGKLAISEGKMVQSSGQSPLTLGKLGAEAALDLIHGEEVEFEVSVDAFSITADNLEEYGIDTWQ